MGQKFGDLSSLSLYVGKTIYKSLALTGQLNYEIAKTQAEDGVDLISYNMKIITRAVKNYFLFHK